ncbi:MAG: HAD-IIIA family hydrolase [Chloroflexi bacterium]|nr:HAD-IIIA family hydrolase [Chloroflexota bacterium]
MTQAIFLDRDGVLNRRAPDGQYVRSWAEFEFLPGALEAVRRLTRPGGPSLIIVTNQRGIARGVMSQAAVDDIHERMGAAVAAAGGVIAGIHVCPHEKEACECRKPGIGMFLAAQRADPALDLAASTVVGDSLADLEAGNRLGARTYLVADDDGATASAARELGLTVDGVAASLLALVSAGCFDDSATIGVPR